MISLRRSNYCQKTQVHRRKQSHFAGAKFAGAILATALVFTQQGANAASLTWNNVLDSLNDGHDRLNGVSNPGIVGSASAYELTGMSWAQDDQNIYFVVKGTTPLGGVFSDFAADHNIGYGDLLLNFTGKSLAEANGSLIGVRFAPTNGSGVSGTGVLSQVTAVSVAAQNDGYSNLNAYEKAVQGAGGTPGLGGLPSDTPYFDRTTAVPNVIGSGTKQGDVTQLDGATLAALGWSPDLLGSAGQYTYGYSFDKSALPTGSFVASLGLECLNDLVAFTGTVTPSNSAAVPEPTTMLGLGLAGAGGAFLKRRQKKLSQDA